MLGQTPSLCSTDLYVFIFLSNEIVLLTIATGKGKSGTFLCPSCKSSPSISLWMGPWTANTVLCLFSSFLKVVGSHFPFPSLLASHEDSQCKWTGEGVTYKYTNWKKRNIMVGHSGTSCCEHIPEHLAQTEGYQAKWGGAEGCEHCWEGKEAQDAPTLYLSMGSSCCSWLSRMVWYSFSYFFSFLVGTFKGLEGKYVRRGKTSCDSSSLCQVEPTQFQVKGNISSLESCPSVSPSEFLWSPLLNSVMAQKLW